MMEAHIAALQEKHTRLEHRLHDELSHAAWSDAQVRRLKEEKLHVKEEIERLRHRDEH